MNGLSCATAIEATVAPIVGFLVALPLWFKDQPILGNIAGTVVIFGTALSLILRGIAIDVMVRKCIDEGVPCFPQPDAFTRFAVCIHRAVRGDCALHIQLARRAEAA
jgi:hypothetical protein